MDPHAQVQAEFNQYSEQRLQEQLQGQIVDRNNVSIIYAPHANLFSSSASTEPASIIPVTTITDAPIAGAPMVATSIPTGDVSAAAVVPPEQVPYPSGGDCCGDCCGCGDCGDCCGCGECGECGDCGGCDCSGVCTIM